MTISLRFSGELSRTGEGEEFVSPTHGATSRARSRCHASDDVAHMAVTIEAIADSPSSCALWSILPCDSHRSR